MTINRRDAMTGTLLGSVAMLGGAPPTAVKPNSESHLETGVR